MGGGLKYLVLISESVDTWSNVGLLSKERRPKVNLTYQIGNLFKILFGSSKNQ